MSGTFSGDVVPEGGETVRASSRERHSLLAGGAAIATGGRLVAGSHNRNEFILINADDLGQVAAPAVSSLPLHLLAFPSLTLFWA